MIFSELNILRLTSLIVFILLIKTFWRKNEPKNLLIIGLLYWLSVSAYVIYSLLDSRSLYELSRYNTKLMPEAIVVGLISLFIYYSALQYKIKEINMPSSETIRMLLNKYNFKKLYLFYIIYALFSSYVEKYSLLIPGGQLLFLFAQFKWCLLSFIIIKTVVLKQGERQMFILIFVEILLSFSGFWSSFKDYILIVIASYLIFVKRISFKNAAILFLSFFLILSMSVIWTYSKGEYRRYLTGGSRSQFVVQNDQFKNISKFFEIVNKDFTSTNFIDNYTIGLENLVHRISSIEFLGMTMQNVPTFIPHENGNLLFNSLEHIIKPRILFPDKKPIYDSELTSKYTGRKFSGYEEGASFSLGTVAEAYIDFGKYYMFFPILIFGLWIGWMYKYFIINGYNLIWSLTLTAPFYKFAWSFSLTTSKFLGWSITYFITFWFINKFLIKYLDHWLLKTEYKS